MVQVKGFVSNIYFYICLAQALLSAGFVISVLPIPHDPKSFLGSLVILCAAVVFLSIPGYVIAPLAYKRFTVSERGIKLGKRFIGYEDIKSITVERMAYFDMCWGFNFIEHYSGMSQHDEIYLEDMICINCDFGGFQNTASVYLPRNRKTDAALRKFCRAYEEIREKKNIPYPEIKTVPTRRIVRAIIFALSVGIIGTLIIGATESGYWRLAFLLPFFGLWVFTQAMKPALARFFRKLTKDRIYKE